MWRMPAFILIIIYLTLFTTHVVANPRIRMETNYGIITLELDPSAAPKTVENFLQYVRDGFYNDTTFHRVIKGLLIQGGGINVNMQEKPARNPIINEADNGRRNLRGTIAMARTNDPHSASSQFFINTANSNYLNFKRKNAKGWGYCVFGKVVNGMDVVNTIENLPTITKGGFHDVPANPVIIEGAIVENDNQQFNSATSGNNEKSDIYNKVSPSVFCAKNSRVYHLDRNCSQLTTTDGLMEFSSPQKAIASGGILCEHCDPSAGEQDKKGVVATTKQHAKTHKSRTTYSNQSSKHQLSANLGLILGSWFYESGGQFEIIEYSKNGTVSYTLENGKKSNATCTWNIDGDTLTIHAKGEWQSKTYIYKILELSTSTYKISGISGDKNVYNAKKIKALKQTTVYITKKSNIYHRRNCFKLNTENLIEFDSPQKATDTGGRPCNYCNSLILEEGVSESNISVATSIEQRPEFLSSVVYSVPDCHSGTDTDFWRDREIKGEVPASIDLTNDKIVKQILEEAIYFAQEECPKNLYPRASIKVYLYQFDKGIPYKDYWVIYGRNHVGIPTPPFTWEVYKSRVDIVAKQRLEAEKKRLEEEAKKAKERKEQEEIYSRSLKFVEKNGVQAWPSKEELSSNPFVYEGKTIAIIATFQAMQSATSGLFGRGEMPFVVASIPKGTFRVGGTSVALAATVLGNIEYNVLGTSMYIPHLKFVGVHFCEEGKDCTFKTFVVE